jgi:hypothetical protein
MAEKNPLSDRDGLTCARDLGFATGLGAYVRLMALELGVNQPSQEEMALTVGEMVPAVNLGVTLAWTISMRDKALAQKQIAKLQSLVDAIPPGSRDAPL